MNTAKDIVTSMKNIDPVTRNNILNQLVEEYTDEVYFFCCPACKALGWGPEHLEEKKTLRFTPCDICEESFCEKCKDPIDEMCGGCAGEVHDDMEH